MPSVNVKIKLNWVKNTLGLILMLNVQTSSDFRQIIPQKKNNLHS